MEGDFDLAVIGAGPIGLEAALRAIDDGSRVVLIESGEVAANVQRWSHVRMFTPFVMNSSMLGRTKLIDQGRALPADDSILSGAEFAEHYLRPLAEVLDAGCTLLTHHTVRSIGRTGYWKSDAIGDEVRQQGSFQLLCDTNFGERMIRATTVIDCSGTYGNPNHVGDGGIPALGEVDVLTEDCFSIPDPTGIDRARFAGHATLVIGSGYSAATTVVALSEVAADVPGTRLFWRTRRRTSQPIDSLLDDPLPERKRLTEHANRLAIDGRVVDWRAGLAVYRLQRDSTGRIHVTLSGHDACEKLIVDRVVANVGYRPDRGLYEELQVHECYASQGPIKLAASLLGQGSSDCMATQAGGPELLHNPEPGFFIVGAKSYGRDPRFLLRTGLQQVEQLLGALRESTEQGAVK